MFSSRWVSDKQIIFKSYSILDMSEHLFLILLTLRCAMVQHCIAVSEMFNAELLHEDIVDGPGLG